jgi:phosphoribosylformylglycinamidine (FGAM) synthase-like amidotransferase family enzyme
MFRVSQIPQMASIQTWRRTGGGTIERWNEDGSPPDVRGIADDHGRIMVVMVHNTDLPDPWEREGEESAYFFRFSPNAYAVGIDILLYAMTH